MTTALTFIFVIGVLVFVHEFGHFIAAKRAGMKVEEFGFGFPPRVLSIKRGETEYSINWIPFGGFVKIFGEDGGHRSDTRSFGSKPFLQRIVVIIAGVAMNFFFAAFLLMICNGFGLRMGLTAPADISKARDVSVQVLEVVPDSPAYTAGLNSLDELVRFTFSDGSSVQIRDPEQVQKLVSERAGESMTINIRRGDREMQFVVSTRANPPSGQGPLGISMALTGTVSYPWHEAIWRGVYDAVMLTWSTICGYATLLWTLVVKHKLIADVSGPIGIAKLTGQAAGVGLSYLMQFVAFISINLAVLNVIPFPALDGGRVVMLAIEKIKGSPINGRVESSINMVGFVALIGLMIYITVKDVVRLF